jgi:hypothetical protein
MKKPCSLAVGRLTDVRSKRTRPRFEKVAPLHVTVRVARHARLLATPTELVNAIAHVLGNSEHHYGLKANRDPFSSAACDRSRLLCVPISWLLRKGWRRARRRPPGFSAPRLLGRESELARDLVAA